MSEPSQVVEYVTCLGCGCACDDIAIEVHDAAIAGARNACPLGVAWFSDGRVPAAAHVRGAPTSIDAALDAAADALAGARRALVFLGLDVSCETQRAAVVIADRLRGIVDGVSSSTVAGGVLAAQRRGRAAATFAEIRARADVIVFWGTDPALRYPRWTTRVAPDAAGMFVPAGRAARTVIAVDVGNARGPADADLRLSLAPDDELDAIGALRAALAGRAFGDDALAARVADLLARLRAARYAVIVYDAEAGAATSGRADALIALAQRLNDVTRAALAPLRAGGNRSGTEAVLTWQTGFPMAVDFSRGIPRYRPDDDAAVVLREQSVDAVLVVGVAPDTFTTRAAWHVAIGPRATAARGAHIAIDTGVAGIHEGGMAFRMDDVPVRLRPPLPGPPVAADVVAALAARITARLASRPEPRA